MIGLTLAFAAPEVLAAYSRGLPLPSTRASDVFSAGLVLFEAVFGSEPPARAEPAFAMPALPAHANPDVLDLLGKLLDADPARRPTAEEALLHPFFADARGISDAMAKQHAATLFLASLAGTDPYPRSRIGFEVVAVRAAANEALARAFRACRRELEGRGRRGAELAEQWAFVGCPDALVEPICAHGLLPVGHPLNPSRSTDPGWFGDCRRGVYVGTCGDYVLKYCKRPMAPLEAGEEVRVIVFKVLCSAVRPCVWVCVLSVTYSMPSSLRHVDTPIRQRNTALQSPQPTAHEHALALHAPPGTGAVHCAL